MHTSDQGTAPRALAYGGLVVATLAAAASAILIRLSKAGPLTIAFWRLALSAAILSVPLLIRRHRELRGLSRRDLALSAASGVFLALHFSLWIASLRLTTVAASTVLVSTHPFLVGGFGARRLGEPVPISAIPGAAAAVVGVALVGWGDFSAGSHALQGDLLAFIGAVAMSGYLLIGRFVRQRVGLLPYAVLVYTVAAILLLVGALLAGEAVLWPGYRELGIFLALAVFPTLLGHTVLNWTLRHVPASVASVSWLGEPFAATVLALVLLGERPGPVALVGGLLILTGIFAFIRTADR